MARLRGAGALSRRACASVERVTVRRPIRRSLPCGLSSGAFALWTAEATMVLPWTGPHRSGRALEPTSKAFAGHAWSARLIQN